MGLLHTADHGNVVRAVEVDGGRNKGMGTTSNSGGLAMEGVGWMVGGSGGLPSLSIGGLVCSEVRRRGRLAR